MHCLEKNILKTCRQRQLFACGEKVVVAVSGGSDSVALLHILAQLSAEVGISLVVAHVNHGLRPAEAGREEQLVRGYATALGLAFYGTALDVRGAASQNGLSLEETARNLRYAYLEEVRLLEGAEKICVGHHGDDQAEEVLLRLIRGAGRCGLSGMNWVRDQVVVRPLLAVNKTAILAYLRDLALRYFDDSSNTSRHFLRNRVRLELLPYLESYNSNISVTLRQTATVLGDEEVLLEAMALASYKRVVTEERCHGNGVPVLCLDVKLFVLEPIALQRRCVEKALLAMLSMPSYKAIADVVALTTKRTGSLLHLARGLRVVRRPALIEFSYPHGITSERGNLDRAERPFCLEVSEPGVFLIKEIQAEIRVEVVEEKPTLTEMKKAGVDFFDHRFLRFPFKIRNRQVADRMHPLGGKGSKTVGRVLGDLKIDPRHRSQVPVVDLDGQVAGLLGVRISQIFRVQETTTSVVKIGLRTLT